MARYVLMAVFDSEEDRKAIEDRLAKVVKEVSGEEAYHPSCWSVSLHTEDSDYNREYRQDARHLN